MHNGSNLFSLLQDRSGGRQFDHEFDDGSRVSIGSPDQEMSQRLHKLCRVWGFAKYYHPKILKGDVNWD